MRLDIRLGACLIAIALGATGVKHADAQSNSRLPEAGPNIDTPRLLKAELEPQNWLAVGRTYGEQRFSPLHQIDDKTVHDLGLAWYLDTDTDRGLEATPIVVDGIMYTTGSWDVVMAVDAKTGKPLWRYDPQVDRVVARHICCDAVNRGVAAWKGRLYLGTLDGRLIAIDGKTGVKVWEQMTVDDPTKAYSITGAPRIVKGKVIIGNGGAEFPVRGYFSAYDAETGKMAWRFYTVPGDPARPQESKALKQVLKSWTGEWWKYGGGGTVWDSMSYDPDLDLLYVGTGNAAPWANDVRNPGGGDNLYTSSILAVRPETGELVWHYQETPDDVWDHDADEHMILTDLKIDGKTRKVLLQASKNGFFYVIDRATGKLVSAKPYVDINWASGVDMKTGRPILTGDAAYENGMKLVKPSPLGGHSWHPMSFSPLTGLVYIPANDIAYPFALGDRPFKPDDVSFATGAATPKGALPPAIAKGHLGAWDPIAQREMWRADYSGPNNGGTLATAGNLVFQGTADKRFIVYRASDGQRLWQMPVQTGIVAAPMSYSVDGEQYVAVMAGWGGIWGLLGSGSAAANNIDRRIGGRILVFKLKGDAHLPAPPVPVDLPPAIQPTGDTATIARGETLFHERCSNCHGGGVIGGGVIPDLRHSLLPRDDQALTQIVLGGVLVSRGMPNFSTVLKEPDVVALQQYILQQSWLEQHPQ
jgi:PQQ-dependent dehydrogenase (methanol/ethanol family)